MENFWVQQGADFSSIDNESRKLVLHPAIAALIDQEQGYKILDYGCGDGAFITLLNKENEIGLFDISDDLLNQAKQNLASYQPVIYTETSAIPTGYFDYVICSLVLMTLSSKEAMAQVLHDLHRVLHNNGTVLIAITHPCFRKEKFSTFETAFTNGRSFNYFKEGESFEVLLSDPVTNATVRFNDYHWTLSTVINMLHDSKLKVNGMYELPDKAADGNYANAYSSPYVIISCCKG